MTACFRAAPVLLVLTLLTGSVPVIPAPSKTVLAPARPAGAGYRWPLAGAVRVTRGFDPPARPWLAGHRGVDLTVPGEAAGTAVRAAGPGVVRYAGRLAGRGVVSVLHENGLRTTYEPVDARVPVGERVFAGDVLGTLAVGHPGCRWPACLHWGLRLGEMYLDPLALLGLGRVRLLPLGEIGPRRSARGGRRAAAGGLRPAARPGSASEQRW